MRARFLGKDPESNVGDSPTLFVTDRTDRRTYIAQGWEVTTRGCWLMLVRFRRVRRLSRYLRMC
jgi:hypothetical protein